MLHLKPTKYSEKLDLLETISTYIFLKCRFLFVLFESSRPINNQSFSYVMTGLPGLNQY